MIAFRADINKEIASGHIMRSIAIAKKVREKGEEVLFISGDDYCSNFLNPCGFDYVTTNSPADSFDDELPLMKSLVDKYDIKCLFVDSYVVSAHYLCEMNKICKVAFIDDYLKEKLDFDEKFLRDNKNFGLEEVKIRELHFKICESIHTCSLLFSISTCSASTDCFLLCYWFC